MLDPGEKTANPTISPFVVTRLRIKVSLKPVYKSHVFFNLTPSISIKNSDNYLIHLTEATSSKKMKQ